jgi:predicted Zn-dependent protease
VDDHPEPLKELRRLVTLQRAYNFMNEGDLAVERKDAEGALKAYSAAQALVPDNAEMVFWTAISLVGMGRVDEAVPLLQRTYKADPRWRELVLRLPKAGLLPDDPKLLSRLAGPAAQGKK